LYTLHYQELGKPVDIDDLADKIREIDTADNDIEETDSENPNGGVVDDEDVTDTVVDQPDEDYLGDDEGLSDEDLPENIHIVRPFKCDRCHKGAGK